MAEKKSNSKKKLHPLRLFESNTILLIFSFLCAIVIWFAMTGAETVGKSKSVGNVPIAVQLSEAAQEANIRVFSQSAAYAEVAITGSASVIGKVSPEDIGITAALNPSVNMLTGNAIQEAVVTLRASKKGNTLADYEVASVSPGEITVLFDKFKEIQLTIENNVTYTAAENYYAAAAPSFSTDLVTISGPESSINRVARAAVVYAFNDALTESKLISSKVVLYDVNGNVLDPAALYLTLSDNTVDVSIQVTSRQTVTLMADVRNMPESFAQNRISIDPAAIEITGDAETISKYKTLTLSTPINFTDVTPDNTTFSVPIPVPSGVTNISKTETATVKFNLNGYSQTTLKTSNISIINKPEGKNADLTTRSLTVTIVGTAAQISKLTSDSVFCTVDLSSVTDPSGSIEVPVSISVTNADSCWATGTYTAHVTISDEVSSGSQSE